MEGKHSSPSHVAPSGGSRRTGADRERSSSEYSRGRSAFTEADCGLNSGESRHAASSNSRAESSYPESEYSSGYDRSQRAAASRSRTEISDNEGYTSRGHGRSYEGEQPVRQTRQRGEGYEDNYTGRSSAARQSARQTPARPAQKPAGFEFMDIIKIVLLTGICLCTFAMFHHVIPRLTAKNQVYEPISTATPIVTAAPASVTEKESGGDESEALPQQGEEQTEEQTAEPEVQDNRTEWQIKFADKFTDEIITTDNGYTSPNISVSIETVSTQINGYNQTYFVADIYVASIDCFRTYFANNKYQYYGAESVSTISKNAGAILSVNGDYCNNQQSGFLVRNGETWFDDASTYDICLLFNDGTMETYGPGTYDPQELLSRGVWQSWKFGPMLIDQNGAVPEKFNSTNAIITEAAPRTGIGYYEPGHYCFIVADGRQGSYARGLTLAEFADIFLQLGCTRAYNLDGGASAVMSFNGNVYNKQSSPRDLGEIALIAEPVAPVATEEEEAGNE